MNSVQNVYEFNLVDRAARRRPPSIHPAATFLAKYTGLPIRIRTVRSTTAASVESDSRLSISVGVYSTLRKRPLDVSVQEWQTMQETAPTEIVADVLCDVEWLVDKSNAIQGVFGKEYANPEFSTVEEAIEWTKTHCLRAPIPRVDQAELDAWQAKILILHDEEGNEARTTLYDAAIRHFGPKYGAQIKVDDLMRIHGLSKSHATMLEAAVLKIVPSQSKRK